MKHLLLTTALITATATGSAMAESSMSGTAAENAGSTYFSQKAEGEIHASDFIGMRVYAAADSGDMTDADGAGTDWEDVGEINDVIISRNGEVEAVLVDIGGFLGIGERQVAMNMDEVQFVSDSSTDDGQDFFLVLNADPDTLQEAPEFLSQAGESLNTMADDAGATIAATADKVESGAEAAGESLANATDELGEDLSQTGEDLSQAANETVESVEESTQEMAESAEATGERIGEETEEMAESAEATGEQIGNEAEEMASDAGEAMTPEADVVAEAEAEMETRGVPLGDDYLTAEALEGARVYDSNDEWVGEVSELIVAGDGTITEAIVDVGGFLGIGEKPVALKVSDLDITRQADSEEVRIYTMLAEDELESMPRFEQ